MRLALALEDLEAALVKDCSRPGTILGASKTARVCRDVRAPSLRNRSSRGTAAICQPAIGV